MANKQATDWVTVEAMRVYAGALERLAARARAAADAVEADNEPGVWCFGGYSRAASEERAATFLKDLEDSVNQLLSGRPYDEISDKKRRRGEAMRQEQVRRERKYRARKHRPKSR